MTISSSTSNSNIPLFYYDCEVDHKELELANITEVCLSKDETYFVGYVKKSQYANYDGPYQKPIPATAKRYEFKTVLEKMVRFVEKNTPFGSKAALMGYNVKGWDEPVLENNKNRFKVETPKLAAWKFVDLAQILQLIGFKRGTTQQDAVLAYRLVESLPANRHRAHADVKVVKELWRKMTAEISKNTEALSKVNAALFLEEGAEEAVAEILKEYDPSLIPSPEALAVIDRLRAFEKLSRKELVVFYDTETTGLFQEQDRAKAESHNRVPRIVEFAAKISSPFKGIEYENETFSSLVNPNIDIPEKATAIHGIKTEELEGKPSMPEVWTAFKTWVKTTHTFKRMVSESQESELEPRIILTGYNNYRYDNPLLTLEMLGQEDLKRQMDQGVLASWDASALTSTWFTGLPTSQKPPNNKMQEIARFFEIPEDEAHRALGDVRTMEKILRKICEPLDPATVIVEASRQKIHLSSPGVGFKEIIRDAQNRVLAQEAELEAVQHAVDNYLGKVRLKEETSAEKPDSKRRKLTAPVENPTSQSFLVLSQNFEENDKRTYI